MVTAAQLVALGFGAGAIKYRRKVGRLHLLHRGVYAVGHRPPPTAHRHRLPRRWQRCSLVVGCGTGPAFTSPARTLVDLADVLNHKQLNEAQVQRLVTQADLTTLLTRYAIVLMTVPARPP